MSYLEKKLDDELALELEIERMRGGLQVMGHMEDPDMKEEIEKTKEKLKEKEEESEFQASLYQALVVKHCYTNDELQDARKALIRVTNSQPNDSSVSALPFDIMILTMSLSYQEFNARVGSTW